MPGKAIALAAAALIGAAALPPAHAQQSPAPDTITVRLSNFDFSPGHIRLKLGVPAHLRLENTSNGGHDFSAPAFFAASVLPPGAPVSHDGAVAVASHQSVEVTVVPGKTGTYRLECTHFLHSIFGMHGSIEVTP